MADSSCLALPSTGASCTRHVVRTEKGRRGADAALADAADHDGGARGLDNRALFAVCRVTRHSVKKDPWTQNMR